MYKVLLTGVLGALVATGAGAAAVIDGCQLYPANNIWNTPIDTAPVHANSAAYINTIGAAVTVHPDFGTVYDGAPNGIPYTTVPGTQPMVPISFTYAGDSDPGPYPLPPDAPIEGGPASNGDRHVLVIDRDDCVLYEVYAARLQTDGSWRAGSGAKWDLNSNALRPATWTSADAAGLPILAGLVRYDEVVSGAITHALRFTAPQTRNTFVWPGRHQASSLTGAQYPPMGQRFRLKAGVDISGYTPAMQVILRALKKYGMMLADNGSAWYLSGAPDPRWNDDELQTLGQIAGSDFEAVDVSALQVAADSGQAVQPVPPAPLPPPPPGSNYDIDGDGAYDALTDGLLMLRYMFGIRGPALTGGATGTGATRNTPEIETLLGQFGAALDIDGDNAADALTDGLLVLRKMFGLSGGPLIAGAIGANAVRTTAQAVSAYMDGFLPALP
ncbi:MAG: hypothetical protein IPI73_29465 [Betaproteobacteria bacterium]|nr:hypothetical protein [Betaproteobacteria bacterium]